MNVDYIYASLPLSIRTKLKRVMMAALKLKLKKFYAQFVKPGNLVFDIGANDGDYTEVFTKLGAQVVAIEPQPVCFEALRQKFKQNKKVKLVQQGIGQKKGRLDFYISSFNNPNSTFSTDFQTKSRYSYRKWDKVIKVDVITLDQLVQTYGTPDFCKIDVEGYEWEILSVLKTRIPVISFEFITEMHQKAIDIIKHLDSLGKATYNVCIGMNYTYEFDSWISGKKLISFLKENKDKNWYGDIYVRFKTFPK